MKLFATAEHPRTNMKIVPKLHHQVKTEIDPFNTEHVYCLRNAHAAEYRTGVTTSTKPINPSYFIIVCA